MQLSFQPPLCNFSVEINTLSSSKILQHAVQGANIEVMGFLLGRLNDATFEITDAMPLPVEGTETRVSAAEEANEYAVCLLEARKSIGLTENVVGWYHSHPGYGCWLSKVDIMTQRIHQTFQDPFVALVVDPHRSVASGELEIKAFRTTISLDDPLEPKIACKKKQADLKLSLIASQMAQTNPYSKGDTIDDLTEKQDYMAYSNYYKILKIIHNFTLQDYLVYDLFKSRNWIKKLAETSLITKDIHETLLLNQFYRTKDKIFDVERDLEVNFENIKQYFINNQRIKCKLVKHVLQEVIQREIFGIKPGSTDS